MELLEQLARHSRRMPERLAACDERECVTWAQLDAAVAHLAARLVQAHPSGTVMLLVAGNELRALVAWLAGLAAGLHILTLPHDLTAPEVVRAAKQSGARAAIADPAHRSALIGAVPAAAPLSDVALIPPPVDSRAIDRSADAELWLLSSGTTAEPKIVCRTAASLDAVGAAVVEAIGFSSADHVLMGVPLCHSYGMEHGILGPVLAGAAVHLQQGMDIGRMLERLTDEQITVLPGVPVMFQALAGTTTSETTAASVRRLRAAYSAGAPLPVDISRAIEARWGLRIGQVYGATEIGSVTFNPPWDSDFDPASAGRPMRQVTLHILNPEDPTAPSLAPGEEGQLAVEAPSLLRGYADGEPLACCHGALLTGDLAMVDGAGRLRLTGRTRLMIDVGGRKVNPLEVEAALAQHPDVREAVVLPLTMGATVQRLRAVVCPAADARVEVPALRAFLRERLAPYKQPRVIEFVADLPRTAAGKVDRARLAGSPVREVPQ